MSSSELEDLKLSNVGGVAVSQPSAPFTSVALSSSMGRMVINREDGWSGPDSSKSSAFTSEASANGLLLTSYFKVICLSILNHVQN